MYQYPPRPFQHKPYSRDALIGFTCVYVAFWVFCFIGGGNGINYNIGICACIGLSVAVLLLDARGAISLQSALHVGGRRTLLFAICALCTWPLWLGVYLVMTTIAYLRPPLNMAPVRRKAGIAALVGALTAVGFFGLVASGLIATAHPVDIASATMTPVTSQTRPPAAPTRISSAPTRLPTKAAARPVVTHGAPHIAGPLSDFLGAYGTVSLHGSGGSDTWILPNQLIINASANSAGMVTTLIVNGDPSWSRAQSEAACRPYLPKGASAFNRVITSVNTLIDYRSTPGEVVMTVNDGGSCVLSLAQS